MICTNIPDTGIGGVPGSHHPQFIDVLHREHACVETAGVRTAKAMGLRCLPSKAWQVNCGWVAAANIAADLAAWTRLLGHHDDAELRDANPDTLRYRVWHLPARLARHARQRTLAISGLAMGTGVPDLLAAALHPARTDLTSTNNPSDTEGGQGRHGRSRCRPGHTGNPVHPTTRTETDMRIKNRSQHNQ